MDITADVRERYAALHQYLDWHAQIVRDKVGSDVPGPAVPSDTLFVRHHGQAFRPAPRPAHVRKMRDRLCYQNSLELAQATGWTYVEGVALSIIPTMHAWCVDEHGNVVDPTYKDPEHCAYFGVPFNLEYACETALRTRVYGIISHTNRELFSTPKEVWHQPLPDLFNLSQKEPSS